MLESARALTPWRCEWRLLNPQKGEIWVEGRSVPTREADGGTLWYGIMVDVTERKRAEEALRRSQARLEAAVRAGGIGTWIFDVRKNFLWRDEQLQKLLAARTAEKEESGPEASATLRPSRGLAEGRARHCSTQPKARRMRSNSSTAICAPTMHCNGSRSPGAPSATRNGRILHVTGACIGHYRAENRRRVAAPFATPRSAGDARRRHRP